MKAEKEQVFKWIDEYMEQRDDDENTGYTIKIDNEDMRAKAFGIMTKMKYLIRTWKEHTYHINGLQKKALDKAGVKYKEVKR